MKKEIQSQPGVISILMLIAIAVGILGLATGNFTFPRVGFGRALIIILGFLVVSASVVRTLSTSICVGVERINIKTLGSSKFFTWQEFDSLNLSPTFFGSYIVQLKNSKSGKTLVPFTSTMRNHKDLVKSILEASTKANPSIKLNNLAIEAYGPPPFGYFE